MNKKHLHHIWTRLRPISHWYFLILFLVSALLTLHALRQNNFRMIELREEVAIADEQNGDIEAALRNLREYVHGHMNTNLTSGDVAIKPPIQLKHRYERLAAAEHQRVQDLNNQVIATAQTHCEQLYPQGQITGRAACVQDYITQHSVEEQPIPDALYKFDFVSPAWSPDLAGWSLVVSCVLLVLFIVRYGMEMWFHAQLAKHQ